MAKEKDARDLLDSGEYSDPESKIKVTEESSVTVMLSKIIELLEQLDWKLWELYGYQKARRDEELLNSNSGVNDFDSFFAEFRTFMEENKSGRSSDETVVSKLFKEK
jgi:hypothetical protein